LATANLLALPEENQGVLTRSVPLANR